MQGECNCGAVRFELNADPAGIFVCHCSICRRATGSNGVAVVVTANENFRWLFGENMIASWKKNRVPIGRPGSANSAAQWCPGTMMSRVCSYPRDYWVLMPSHCRSGIISG